MIRSPWGELSGLGENFLAVIRTALREISDCDLDGSGASFWLGRRNLVSWTTWQKLSDCNLDGLGELSGCDLDGL